MTDAVHSGTRKFNFAEIFPGDSQAIDVDVDRLARMVNIAPSNKQGQILQLLNSDEKDDLIKGAYMAGETGKKDFVPLLLKNADDIRTSTNIKFKGYSVYQEKMITLRKIFKQEPPVKITNEPDSVVIIFYTEFAQKAFDK